jgi:hypothetical protein
MVELSYWAYFSDWCGPFQPPLFHFISSKFIS